MSLKMKELPTSERPYEKLEIYGAKKLSNSELLAIIIKTGTREETAISLAQKVMSLNKNKNNNINSLKFLQNISIEELCKIKGIGKVKAIQIIAACEIARRMQNPLDVQNIKITNSQDVADLLMNELKYEKREIAKIILLNTKNIIQKIIDISFGGTNFTMLEPKDVLYEAVKSETPKIIVVHNHPSGDPTPSKEDINVTRRLISSAEIIGLSVLDHVIIAERRMPKYYEIFINKESLNMGFFNLGSKDIGIDLGTANILVTLKGKGIVLIEPSVVAIDRKNGNIVATGEEAKEMLGRTPEQIKAVRPLKDGVIADFTATRLMLKNLIEKISSRYNIGRPRVVVGVPSGITEVEERAVEESVMHAGAKEVYLMEEPMAAAIGAGLDVAEPSGNIIVDIGGGTTEVAVISLGGIVISNSLRTAGDELDEDIVNYIKRKYNTAIGETTAEEIKKEVGCALPLMTEKKIEIRGRDLSTGLPKNIDVSSTEIQEAMEESISDIIDIIKATLEKTPPELASDIMEKGIILAGGGALIENIDKLVSEKTGMPVFIAETPLECVVKGTGKTLEDLEKLKNVLLNARKMK